MQRVMQNPEFLQAAESLGRGLMTQVADPEMMTMMELFSNPDNQGLLKAKMEELKGDPELKEVMEDIEQNGQGAMMKYMQVRWAAPKRGAAGAGSAGGQPRLAGRLAIEASQPLGSRWQRAGRSGCRPHPDLPLRAACAAAAERGGHVQAGAQVPGGNEGPGAAGAAEERAGRRGGAGGRRGGGGGGGGADRAHSGQ
jgi:hypothetical protein